MKKKGFTLVEMTVVIAILGILLSIAYINFGKIHSKSQVDSAANEIASMLKEVYENGNKSMNFQDYYIQIIKSNDKYEIVLNNKHAQIRMAEYKNIEFEFKFNDSNFTLQSNNYVYFTSDGDAIFKHHKSEDGQKLNKIIIDSKSGNQSKTVNINSLPPGNITVE